VSLLNVERGGYYQHQGGNRYRPCDLHIWLGPIGVHVFRDPFKLELDWLGREAWREERAGSDGGDQQERRDHVLLCLKDAITFTEPAELEPNAFQVFAAGLDLFYADEFSEAEEEAWLSRLLEAGWNLAPAVDPAAMGEGRPA
jgi:hypothetical protein